MISRPKEVKMNTSKILQKFQMISMALNGDRSSLRLMSYLYFVHPVLCNRRLRNCQRFDFVGNFLQLHPWSYDCLLPLNKSNIAFHRLCYVAHFFHREIQTYGRTQTSYTTYDKRFSKKTASSLAPSPSIYSFHWSTRLLPTVFIITADFTCAPRVRSSWSLTPGEKRTLTFSFRWQPAARAV